MFAPRRFVQFWLAMLLLPAPALAQPAPERPIIPRPESITVRKQPSGAAMIRDEVGIFSDDERQRLNGIIDDIYRRNGCRIVIEAYRGLPGGGPADPNDAAAIDRANLARVNQCMEQAGRDRIPHCVVIVTSVQGRRSACDVGSLTIPLEEKLRLKGEIIKLHSSSFGAGMPDVLAYIRQNIGSTTQGGGGKVQGGGATGQGVAALEAAARSGGLSATDVQAIVRDRGPVPADQLADFITGQVKEGRKGADLKKDVDYFIKVYKERTGK